MEAGTAARPCVTQQRVLREAITQLRFSIAVSIPRCMSIFVVLGMRRTEAATTSLTIWCGVLALLDVAFLPLRIRDLQEYRFVLQTQRRVGSAQWARLETHVWLHNCEMWFECVWYICGALWFFMSHNVRRRAATTYWLTFALIVPVLALLGFVVLCIVMVILCLCSKSLQRRTVEWFGWDPVRRERLQSSSAVVVTIQTGRPSLVTLNTEPTDSTTTEHAGLAPALLARVSTTFEYPGEATADGATKASAITPDDADDADESRPTCSICLMPFVGGDACRRLPCQHVFHRVCLDTWLARGDRCPLCNDPLKVRLAALPSP